jgi:6-phosphofructokinase
MPEHLLILQCGGPTAVINASLAAAVTAAQHKGVAVAAAQRDGVIDRVFGGLQGWAGLSQDTWVDLTELGRAQLAALAMQPGAALGSGRVPLRDDDLPAALAHLRARGVGMVCVIGGNGTMAAARKLEQAAHADGLALRVVGIPKTIDNDLYGTDVAPGYGSAARFVAQSTRDMALDLHAMGNFDEVTVVEWMGRHVGWLTAAAAAARRRPDDAPHLILLPERPVDEDDVLAAIAAVHAKQGVCMVAASEGVRDTAGVYWAEKGRAVERDASGQKLLSLAAGVAPYLAQLVQQRLGLRCRQVRPDTLQRSSRALVSAVDRGLAEQVGADAVHAAAAGQSGVMVGLQRVDGKWSSVSVPFDQVVGRERALPAEFVAPARFDVTDACLAYVRPLVQPMANDDLLWTPP